MDPDGPATWLVTLELNPAAISLCAIDVGPNGIGGRDAVKRPVKLKNTEAIPLFYKNTDQKWTVFSKKIILDKYKFIYSEKRLQCL